MGGKFAETFKRRLAFEFERPGYGAAEIHALLLDQGEQVAQGLRGVSGKQRSVTIGVLRVVFGGAGGAAFRVGFAEDDGRFAPFREGLNDLEAFVNRLQLASDS